MFSVVTLRGGQEACKCMQDTATRSCFLHLIVKGDVFLCVCMLDTWVEEWLFFTASFAS